MKLNLLKGDLRNQLKRCQQAQLGLGAALVVVAALLYALQIGPTMRQLDRARNQHQQVWQELQLDQTQAGRLPEVQKSIDRLRVRVERFDKKLPRKRDIAPFITEISRISEESDLKRLVWQPDAKPVRTDQFAEWPIKFTFEGDYKTGVMEFLRRTEDMQRLTRIQKLDIRSDDAHDGQVNAELTMNIYFAEE